MFDFFLSRSTIKLSLQADPWIRYLLRRVLPFQDFFSCNVNHGEITPCKKKRRFKFLRIERGYVNWRTFAEKSISDLPLNVVTKVSAEVINAQKYVSKQTLQQVMWLWLEFYQILTCARACAFFHWIFIFQRPQVITGSFLPLRHSISANNQLVIITFNINLFIF